MKKSKKAISKERRIYEYLKKSMFESYAKDENGLLLVNIETYLNDYNIEYDINNKPIKISKETEDINENNRAIPRCIDNDFRPFGLDDIYGYKTHGGSISLNGDYVPSYFDKDDDHPGSFGRMF